MSTGLRWLWLVVLTACGRIGFHAAVDGSIDPAGDGPIDAVGNGPSDLRSTAQLWLKMEEPDPTTGPIVDEAGHHTVLCATTVCPTSAAGKHGNGFRFTGQQQLQITWQPDLDASQGYTIAVWVLIDPAVNGSACAFTKPVAPVNDGDSYSLCVDPSSMSSGYTPYTFTSTNMPVGAPGSDFDKLAADMDIAASTWHHLAASWERIPGTSMGTKTIYIDGVAKSDPVVIDFDQSPPVVGADTSTGPVYPWKGVLDDVLFFGRVLIPSEIVQLSKL